MLINLALSPSAGLPIFTRRKCTHVVDAMELAMTLTAAPTAYAYPNSRLGQRRPRPKHHLALFLSASINVITRRICIHAVDATELAMTLAAAPNACPGCYLPYERSHDQHLPSTPLHDDRLRTSSNTYYCQCILAEKYINEKLKMEIVVKSFISGLVNSPDFALLEKWLLLLILVLSLAARSVMITSRKTIHVVTARNMVMAGWIMVERVMTFSTAPRDPARSAVRRGTVSQIALSQNSSTSTTVSRR
jgi:hypothetical protein